MDNDRSAVRAFLDAIGADEEPMGMFYTDTEPSAGFSPTPQPPITREAEALGTVDWDASGKNFSCVMGKIWLARKKSTAAYFDKERFGCYGGAFFLGFTRPHLKRHALGLSTGVPGISDGERYFESPEAAEKFLNAVNPAPAPARFLVVKPLSQFTAGESPAIILFFARPEVISGLSTLAMFVTNDIDVVRTPFGQGCVSLVTWPFKFLKQGKLSAVLGSFDPGCRQYLKNDEMSIAVPSALFRRMLARWKESFMTGDDWANVKKKIVKSGKARKETL